MHGTVGDAARKALEKQEHTGCTMADLDSDAPDAISEGGTEGLLGRLQKKQWNLMTTDGDLVRDLYEKKVQFKGVIVQILSSDAAEHADAVERLFERYKRLTPGRLYTVTGSRVKIRQLPGGHAQS
jgi:hypothetical protein